MALTKIISIDFLLALLLFVCSGVASNCLTGLFLCKLRNFALANKKSDSVP